MLLGAKVYDKVPAGTRVYDAVRSGKRRYGKTEDMKEGHIEKGLEVLMNRSDLKAIVDHGERSKAIGMDVMKKMASLENATGKDRVAVVKMIGERA